MDGIEVRGRLRKEGGGRELGKRPGVNVSEKCIAIGNLRGLECCLSLSVVLESCRAARVGRRHVSLVDEVILARDLLE